MKITGNTIGKPAESTVVLIEDAQKAIEEKDELAAVKKEFEEYRKSTKRQMDNAYEEGFENGVLETRMARARIVRMIFLVLVFFGLPWYVIHVMEGNIALNVATKLESILTMKDCAGGQLSNKTLL